MWFHYFHVKLWQQLCEIETKAWIDIFFSFLFQFKLPFLFVYNDCGFSSFFLLNKHCFTTLISRYIVFLLFVASFFLENVHRILTVKIEVSICFWKITGTQKSASQCVTAHTKLIKRIIDFGRVHHPTEQYVNFPNNVHSEFLLKVSLKEKACSSKIGSL